MEGNLTRQWLPLSSEGLFSIIVGVHVCCGQLNTNTNNISYMVTLIYIFC